MEQLEIEKTSKLLEKYGLPFSKYFLVKSKEEAVKAAKKLKFPVVMKTAAKEIVHKSDVGCVITGINNEKDAEKAYLEIIKNTSKLKKTKEISNITKVIVQRTEKGEEVIVGMKRDAQFGPVLMFGLGGIFVEILKDVSFRIAPVNKDGALEMIKETKASKILFGARGKKPTNIYAIADIITKLSKLSEDKKIKEIDLNPIIVNEKKATIVDARIIVD
ncbi:MAG: acetate--CoA ligase family protein [Candidatus Woesearchaeota archaeon]|nr:acetate--CoA ligase family protein [Candidatus Woesearchaeota archaeon]